MKVGRLSEYRRANRELSKSALPASPVLSTALGAKEMMMSLKSTFEINHDTCHPEKWTASDVLVFADFVRTGNLGYAATLSRLGVKLVSSDHLSTTGGTLQECGWAKADNRGVEEVYEDLSDLADDDVTAVCRVYRGPTEYAARYATGDDEGNFEGYEFEMKATEAEADEYLVAVYDAAESRPA